MVATAQSRGHAAQAAHTGQEALALLAPGAFDAVIVDLLLPDMRGSAVLEALRMNGTPAIAVSGVYKGETFAREAIDVHGARAFFEKPFELTAVLEAVEKACGAPAAPPPPPTVGLAPEEEAILEMVDLLVIEDEPVRPVPPPLPKTRLSAEAAGTPEAPASTPPPATPEAAGAPEATVTPEAAASPEAAVTPEAPVTPEAAATPEAPAPEPVVSAEEAALTLALPFAQREKVWTKEAEAPAPAPARPSRRELPQWTLEGEIKAGTIPRLLNAYYQARHHGELKLKQGTALKVVYFESGRLVYAASNLANERFARFCARRGLVPESALPELTRLTKEGVRSGDALVRLGLLTAEQRRQLIEEQVKEIVWSTFSWSEGAYGFSPMRPKRSDLVKLSVFPGNLILEGVLKTETLVALRQQMPATRRLFPSADPPYALHELKLSGPQALLLAYADGSKTVEDLLSLTDLPVREALATLRALELLRVLEERREEPTSRSRISFGL